MLIKRMLSLAIAVTMATSLFVGCGKKVEKDTTDAVKTQETKSYKIRFSKSYHSGLEEAGKAGENIVDNRFTQAYEKDSGINVTWEFQPKTDGDQKIAMMFAGGDFPDLISLTKAQAFKYYVQGVLMPVNELMDKYTPEYKKITPKEPLDAVMQDGKYVGFPAIADDYTKATTAGIIVRRDIMNELGLKDPKTIDEFTALLKAVKEKKPDMIPLDVRVDTNSIPKLNPIEGAFGVAPLWAVSNGKVVHNAIQPGYKDYILYVKSLYNQGLINKEFSLNKDLKANFQSGKAFATIGGWADTVSSGMKNTLLAKFPTAKIDFIPYPEGKNGLKGSAQKPPFANNVICVPVNAKEKEGGAKFIDYCSTEKAGLIQDYGIEGIDYKVQDGKIATSDEQQSKAAWRVIYTTVSREGSFNRRVGLKGYTEEFNRYTEVCKGNIMPDIQYNFPPIEKVDSVGGTLAKHQAEFITKVIMGAASINDWDKYVADFNTKGGKDAIAAVNEWYAKNGKK